ncbi:MAG: hypothetical protein SWN98_04405 [Pseudomonadota bacterium]|jgi:hypothetical protein|nr:hypothetical protein JT55_10480 [Rhodovulum sp. NI22]MDY6858562.1 hypothetical protein [Pseudomonadota bacterium]
MAIAKIWHYSGHLGEEENTRTQLAREPYISRQQVSTSAIAAGSLVAPSGSHLARIEVTTATRYRVRLAGDSADADANDPLLFTADQMAAWNWIHLPPGATLSLIEAA